ncbi:hypothetical protein C8F04DRAFT_1180815 [Mycena alexandri]|uniref:CxC2-like cysteine cluster KDZ transposase-associated domain-containing protein n=1 Tax=Mycena alexandri TaxID=1745969 RepID=A0AAD6X9I3_9AGAR|nr:hypothetical protein C8F04DRAFT_1180815 [Mycena alexandri]
MIKLFVDNDHEPSRVSPGVARPAGPPLSSPRLVRLRHHPNARSQETQGSTSAASAPPPAPARNAQILTEITRISTDGSVRRDNRMAPVPTSSVSKENEAPLLLPDEPAQTPKGAPVYDLYEQAPDDADDDAPFLERVAREMRDSDYPLKEWVKDERDTWLEELLRAEGRGDHRSYSACPRCKVQTDEFTAVPMYRCEDCLRGGEMLCQGCMVSTHLQSPLHRIEKWTGEMFERTTLKDLGLRIQLGHWDPADPRCAAPDSAAGEAFVIVDSDGVHEVALDFCGCGPGGAKSRQLLRAGLYAATGVNPRTAATFGLLRRFHLLSLESKISAYEFYNSLARGTNNTGIEPLAKVGDNHSYRGHWSLRPAQDRYHEFLRMTRQWRSLQMLKRAGRGHDPTGPMGTAPGECALLCPACPQPGKNLPENWENAPDSVKFIYALFLAMDANFRLKRKDVSSEEADPGLGSGWSFFLRPHNWDQPQERSTCVAHDAVDQPDREARGTASSGIGAVNCARHNMKRPNAVGDLQFGERYINMDYMFFKSITGTELQRFYVSYDIACQWHKNIWSRMEDYAPEIHYLPEGKFMSFLVPKFHLPAHIEACNLRFSFNLTRNVGQTDGEAPERGWANANPLASSTKEMGPGARRDTLDDHFNDWNYKKIIAFGRAMLKKMENAVPQMVEKKAALAEMEVSLEAASGALEEGPVEAWTAMAEKWEEDPDAPNPFETMSKEDHVARVQHDLAVEAADREARGENVEGEVRDDMHITEMIAMGLQLEDHQRTLGFDTAATGLHPTTNQRRVMVERTSKLRRKIVAWMDIQHGFFPSVKVLRSKEDEARARIARTQPIPGLKVHELKLWLPSALMKLPGASGGMSTLQTEAVRYEYRLRVGQAIEALDEIRRQLLVRTRLYKRKDANVRGVRDNMRSKSALNVLDNRVRRMATQYRVARRALETLGSALGERSWEKALKPLQESDVRGMPRATFGDPERQRGGTQRGSKQPSRKKAKKDAEPAEMSWIWVVQVDPGNPAAVSEGECSYAAIGDWDTNTLGLALRIEWAKARARALRWTEEVDLLEEEMRRIQQFLTWRAGWWRERADGRGREQDGPQREGERAYAYRQAKLQEDLCANFAAKWAHLPELVRKGRAGELDVLPAARINKAEDSEGSDDEGSENNDSDDGARPVPRSSKAPIDPLDLE